MTEPPITCPSCGKTSHSQTDARMGWCANCNAYHGDMGRNIKWEFGRLVPAARIRRALWHLSVAEAEAGLLLETGVPHPAMEILATKCRIARMLFDAEGGDLIPYIDAAEAQK